MKHTCLLILLAGAVFLGGCDKQTRLNTEKIAVQQRTQSQQLAAIQSQMTSLAPMLDKMNDFYFEKSHDEAFFFHTNTLYLMLTVGQKIQAQLQAADTDRETEHALAYAYHTNQLRTMYLCTAELEETLTAQESRIVDRVNVESRHVALVLSADLSQQIKRLEPDQAEIVQRQEMVAELKQIKSDLELIKARLGITNRPAAQP